MLISYHFTFFIYIFARRDSNGDVQRHMSAEGSLPEGTMQRSQDQKRKMWRKRVSFQVQN